MAQLNNLIVTGSSRFLNKINGACTDGTTVSSQTQSTKFLRQDGTWAAPSYTSSTTVNHSSVAGGIGVTVSASAVVGSTTYTVSHDTSPITAGTYQSVTVDATGHVTAGSALSKAQITTALGYTPPTSDTNNAVTQTATTTNGNYEVLFSGTADNTTRTEGAKKTSTFIFNPAQNALLIGTLKDSTALGEYAFAYGQKIEASGNYAHAYGYNMVASGYGSYAGGENNSATGRCSHAEGSITTAEGWYSHAEGRGTYAKSASQHVFGEYNIIDTSSAVSGRGTYVEIVGNGASGNSRSNARRLDWSGNEWIAGTLTQGSSRKIKKNIEPISQEEVLSLLKLDAVKFDYKTSETDTQKERGFIAEDVANILPCITTPEQINDNGDVVVPASLNYIALIPLLVELCKQQQEEIDELKQQINTITERM